MSENNKFTYHYSHKQHEEVKEIRNKYISTKENKIDQLKELDNSATTKAAIKVIPVGTMSTILFGLGMTFTIKGYNSLFIPGIIIGTIGLIGMAMTPIIHKLVLKKERSKIADRIIALSDEILNDE